MSLTPRHLVITYHTCPTEQPGQDLAGGMNILLLGFLRHTSWPTDVVTRGFAGYQVEQLSSNVTLHRLPCGASRPWSREQAWAFLPAYRHSFQDWLEGRSFDVASAHYWMSGTLLDLLNCPAGIIFHTLQAQKGEPVSDLERQRALSETTLALHYPCGFLHWHDLARARSVLAVPCGSVVRPGCDIPAAAPRAPGQPKVFGWAARPDAIKNFPLALRTLATIGSARLVVAGSQGESMAGVEFLGSLPPDQMAGFYDRIDQLWNLSHYETFGLGVLEALTRGATVGLNSDSDWARRLRRLGVESQPGSHWTTPQRETAHRLAQAYSWLRALPSWERWLRRLSGPEFLVAADGSL